MAETNDGRQTLTVVYEAIITGRVTEFEREQANKVLKAKARAYKPEDYAQLSRIREGGKRTRIFPIRFMRAFAPGHEYATPLAELMPNGNIRVKYPSFVLDRSSMFKEEVATLEGGFFLGKGEEINPNEIVGIKDYETGGGVLYLPALALIDYSNQAIRSTGGKILEVSVFAATMGVGSGAVVGSSVAATEARMTAIWAARLAKGASMLDRAANVIEIASFVINENRDWIISKLGEPGKRLVQISNITNSVAGIYGIGRLAQGGYKIVKEMRAASKAARGQVEKLTQAEAATLRRLDDETDAMLKQMDDEAAKSGRAAAPAAKTAAPPGGKPGAPPRLDDPAAVKPPAKAAPKPAAAVDDLDVAAGKIGISKTQLHAEVEDLRGQTVDLDLVHQPRNPKFDAEMEAQGHNFTRNKTDRTWCRESKRTCQLNLGKKLNTETDGALAKKQAKFAAIEQQRKAHEASSPRARDPKHEPAAKAQTDPTPQASKAEFDRLPFVERQKLLDEWMKQRGVKRIVDSNDHHAWPKYLGGPEKGPLIGLDEQLHRAFHSALDKELPRQLPNATKYYAGLSQAEKLQNIKKLKAVARDFDMQWGSRIGERLNKALQGTPYENLSLEKLH
jgi:hypothetical protein